MTVAAIETHPIPPFLPEGAKILMLGSFPPKKERWSMDFFYPNFNNDMWRIVGEIFFNDRNHFTGKDGKSFEKDRIVEFCESKGIALYDTVCKARRLKDNASDRFLEVMEASDIREIVRRLPDCGAIAVTGQKAAEIIAAAAGCKIPEVGTSVEIRLSSEDKTLKFYRMPSSSRAYPLALEKKAAAYSEMFENEGLL